MPRARLRKILPSHEKIKEQKLLKIFGKLLYKREIWSFSRRKILGGVFIGMFVAFIPMPFQMPLVALLAIIFNVNLPITILLVWISNPLTMPFIYYFEYELGNFVLNVQDPIKFSFETMNENINEIALSLYVGTAITSTVLAFLSVFILNLLWIKDVRNKRR
ncbi:MAG: flagellar biosynthesis protein FlhF [Arcobacter sp.]|nr:flagellar biosynthesis protein FlhF [Arcobacter sp.]|tara:strand:+ start:12462 stop:12947 length:486 start_codon:yes stop_codon:yes gene_type:complete